MPLRTRLFIIISIIVLAILGISIFLLILGKQKTPGTNGTSQQNQTSATIIDSSNFVEPGIAPRTSTPTQVKVATPEEVEKNAAKQIAGIFLERYNSFSTDNNYQNILSIKDLVTSALWKRLSTKLNTPSASATTFMGVTTEVLGATLKDWSETSATVELQERKTTTKNGSATVVYDKTSVKMVKTGGNWLVDSFAILK